ncbi:arylsulfatase [Draconibacterium sediminis]|uniref:N-acetylgalactosamine 6-sulfate sulfatase n=1 Tax=Draconibacterium sediminis TaxID=1544798 RepID=A0A0D8JBN1_9BACT|nr:arylsulfatase [Draconibacterium sediminis]KJF43198.1 N-acetylgalactosamine 6-sulfate sulfatase [Draconibacterium sediminis]
MKNLLLLLFLFLLLSCSHKPYETKPNIIIILTDDQGWGDLSCNGNTNIKTPNIDKLAETGVTFDRFYVCAVCSPTRAELLTGRYHVRSGVWSTGAGGERMDLDETTLAEVFKNAGYTTAAYGKWHNGMQAPYHPNSRGFDDFYGFCSGHWGNYFSPMLEHNGEIVTGNGFIIDDFTQKGLNFIEENKDQPFLLYLPFNTPHSPMQVPDRFWEKYKNKNLEMFNRNKEKEDTLFTKAALAMCENIDWNVGRIAQKLEELELTENTIILYLSDNGPNSVRWNGNMKGKKGSTDEGGVRSPLIMKWKGNFSPGKEISEIASGIDLLPTLAELAGINMDIKNPLDGISLKPLLMDDATEWKDRIIYNYWGGRLSLRSQKFRLDHENKLFDMENDPEQYFDVSEKYPNEYQELLIAKTNWQKNVASELDINADRPFPIGHPSVFQTQLPARDAIATGNIKRSNRWPNSSFLLNWTSTEDKITFDAEVLNSGNYEVELFYTCPEEQIGSTIKLSFNEAVLEFKIDEAFNSPLLDNMDIYPRAEGYVKQFKRKKVGNIYLEKGKGLLTMQATFIPGSEAMDFRLVLLRKI